ncbi:Type IV secretory pathway, VirD4 component, TraG/TraD family ATPase [Dyadobacter soli]|uniref:Type IV secretory pathway, VirD4 component, TraG/TraD family ATPase n=1 Tax=Dyadobacter soli TaxID=659014 RepID=A0A1G7MJX1_9BACT|nr:conjugal transfer protein MobC [Dyadobacter soli]SDF62032.1 Type IV secretory pathway, VirD4 component, TraG/TraD family ATPase [Dyadobacter soli]
MASQTSENQQALARISEMTRLIAIAILALHFYYSCYAFFASHHLVSSFTDRVLVNIIKTGMFSSMAKSKLISLGLLIVSLIGTKGRKQQDMSLQTGLNVLLPGLLIYWASGGVLLFRADLSTLAWAYILSCSLGFVMVLSGTTLLSRVIQIKLGGDIFNSENESFPQQERLLENQYSVNLPAEYSLKGKRRKSWINLINPFRGLLVLGSPGSGKSYFIIRHIISQHIRKGFSLFIYDFKFDDLSVIAYNNYLKNKARYKVAPTFYTINFDDLSKTHRCNPLEPASMHDITDAAESARTILMGLNREWIKKQGDFFVESSINFLTAVIWFLRRYQDGEYCTLPHVIELMQTDYEQLFSVLRTEKEIEVLVNPFISAYQNDAMEQLEGQIASAKIALARLSSPQLYFVLSGNDLTLDINSPDSPKIVCIGNNPQKVQIYGAVVSLFVTRLIKLVNTKGKLKSSLIFDEFPTIYLNNIDSLIATARSNKVATTLAVQDFSQLRKDYGKEQADVLMNITGNLISGQVSGETAKQLSERFGKIQQGRTVLSVNRTDTTVASSMQLDLAVPASKIAALSSGEFVGMVADNPDELMPLKAFHCRIINDHKALAAEQDAFKPIPSVREVSSDAVRRTFSQIKQDVQEIVDQVLAQINQDPALQHLLVVKKRK